MSENTPQPVPTPTPTPTATPTGTATAPIASPKFWPAFLLCMFLGCFGAHRFYLKSPHRVLMLCTFGVCGLWALVDCVTILLGKFKDETGALIPNPKPAVSWTVFGIMVLVGMANGGKGGGGSCKIEGDTAKATYYASAIQSPMIHGGDLANQVWEIAKANAAIKKIEVTVIFTGDTIVDSYGKAQPGPYIMGTVDVSDLEEVRKYEKLMYWSTSREFFGFQIRNMRYGNCFQGKD